MHVVPVSVLDFSRNFGILWYFRGLKNQKVFKKKENMDGVEYWLNIGAEMLKLIIKGECGRFRLLCHICSLFNELWKIKPHVLFYRTIHEEYSSTSVL